MYKYGFFIKCAISSFPRNTTIYSFKYNFKFKILIKDYLLIAGIIIPSSILYYFFDSFALIVLLVGCAIFLYSKVQFYSILTVLSCAIIMFFSNFVTVITFVLFENYLNTKFLIFIVYITIFSGFSILFGVFFRFY